MNNFPERIGVTANLDVNYRAPTGPDQVRQPYLSYPPLTNRHTQFLVIKTKLDTLQGRRAVVSGRVEDLQGTLLVEATGTFVQPKYAELLNSGILVM